jgi:hypothetical protein
MVIDMLSLPDGTLYSGLLSIELVNVLRGSAILEGCNVYLVHSETMKLREKDIDVRSSAAGAIPHDTGLVIGDKSGVVVSPGKHHELGATKLILLLPAVKIVPRFLSLYICISHSFATLILLQQMQLATGSKQYQLMMNLHVCCTFPTACTVFCITI